MMGLVATNLTSPLFRHILPPQLSLLTVPCLLSPPSPSGRGCSRRRIHLWRRQGLTGRLRTELGEDRSQGADARRGRVVVVLNDLVKLLSKSGGFFVCLGKEDNPHMGSRFLLRNRAARALGD